MQNSFIAVFFQISSLQDCDEEISLFPAKGVDEVRVRAYSSPPQLTQRTKQAERNRFRRRS
ncbi:hypothetical protein PWG14_21065, partial (plasmid) [Chromobacterium amazonense]|uniref:hypothetical protein n=1 Tax=Chromobacterium amazonense TaxID=1382803 RepID=UPI00237EDB85